jgi:protease I
MANRLIGKKIALILEEGYDEQQVTTPLNFLKEEGAGVRFVGPSRSTIYNSNRGTSLSTDLAASEVRLADFDAFIIPGGQATEKMRLSDAVVKLISDADENGKVIAAIGHGPQLLISSGVVKDRMMTCTVGIKIDVKNAGAYYVDEAVVRDGNVISSRSVADLPDFLESITDALSSASSYQKSMFAGA